ncbi:MAG: hypothetical protein KatS3mg045_1799 [Bellilinea sp.]|nr:MAG: hypothetical protein KatS3mg045_1799 [Bellilinea sp.]
MILSYIIGLLPYLISAGICVWVGRLATTRKQDVASRALAGLAYSEALWVISYILQILSNRLEIVLLWNNVQFLAASLLPVFYFGFALDYNYRQIPFKRFNWKILFVFAGLMVAFIWSDGLHGLFRINPQVIQKDLFYALVFQNGAWFGIYTIYAYTLIILATLFFVVKYIGAPHLFRQQVGTLLIGTIIPWLVSIITAAGVIPFELHDVVPLSFGVSNLIIAWALFRHHLLDIVPVARDTLFENLADAVIVVDASKRVVDANPAASACLSAPPETLIAREITSLLPLAENWADFGVGRTTQITEISLPGKGTTQHYQVKVNRLIQDNGELSGYILTLHNITEQKQVELDLRRSMALLQATVESSASGLVVFNQDLNVILFNQRLVHLFDLPNNWQNQIDHHPLDMLAQKMTDASPFLAALESIIQHATEETSITLDLHSGVTVDCLMTTCRLEGKQIGWLFSFRDITERKLAEQKLHELAITDSLTGVFNRRHFYYVAQTELERSHRYDRNMAIILLDIDHFKWINDTFGHLVGDQMLQTLAQRCRNNLRVFDTIGRFGGEEFIILLPETCIKEAVVIAERLRHAVESISIPTSKGKASITISLGVACFEPGKPVSLDQLVDAADKALYQAKENGRNRVAVYQQQQDKLPGID